MNKVTVLVFLFYASVLQCQECKYKKNEVDDFTKSKILETNFEWLAEQAGYVLKKVDDSRTLQLRIESLKMISIQEGNKVMFLTEREEPITVHFPKFEISKRSSGPVTTYYIIENINITEEVYQRFKNETISKIRVYTNDGYLDKNIKDKRANKFRELIKCIE